MITFMGISDGAEVAYLGFGRWIRPVEDVYATTPQALRGYRGWRSEERTVVRPISRTWYMAVDHPATWSEEDVDRWIIQMLPQARERAWHVERGLYVDLCRR